MAKPQRFSVSIVNIALAAFACSDGNNGQVTYPKPEGPAVGHWRTFEPYSRSELVFDSGVLIAGDEFLSWSGSGVFNDCTNDGCRSGRIFNLKTEVWRDMTLSNAPSVRYWPKAAWTGSEAIFWGGLKNSSNSGCLNDGGIYDPTTDSWRSMSTTGAPSVRTGDWPTWTGNEVLFWGGSSCGSLSSQRDVYGDGAAYNPTTDTWRPISSDGAPSPRDGYAQVWTGKELVIWSGDGSGAPDASDYDLRDDGYAYNPTTDTWRKISNEGAPKGNAFVMRAWTGTEMLLWGGTPNETMAAYNPETDSWRKLNASGPHLFGSSCEAWTGKYWIICGDAAQSEDGALYDPVADIWHPIVAGPTKDFSGMSGYPYAGDMIVIGGDGASGMHGSDLELYRFVIPD